jgi:hypothetical protein
MKVYHGTTEDIITNMGVALVSNFKQDCLKNHGLKSMKC